MVCNMRTSSCFLSSSFCKTCSSLVLPRPLDVVWTIMTIMYLFPLACVIIGCPEARDHTLRLVEQLEFPVASVRVKLDHPWLQERLRCICEVLQGCRLRIVRTQGDVHAASVALIDAGILPILLDRPFAYVHHFSKLQRRSICAGVAEDTTRTITSLFSQVI